MLSCRKPGHKKEEETTTVPTTSTTTTAATTTPVAPLHTTAEADKKEHGILRQILYDYP